jgi:predicted metalloprotease with PDZ domain
MTPASSAKAASTIEVGGATIQVAIDPSVVAPGPEVVDWIRRAADAVTVYLGRFPVKHLLVAVHGGGDEPIGGGVTHGASDIEVRLSQTVSHRDFATDWIMTHEMFHLAFPTLDRRYEWMMEGLSDYLEPIARARAGQWSAAEAWREFVEGLPQGLPEPGDRGLDNTHTRERIYWGGNLFWLLADVRIRAQTQNRYGVDDVIRAILAEGGNGGANWTLERVLAEGDHATHTSVLTDLHDEIGSGPGEVDLDALWRKLGIKYRFHQITFDDTAPLAGIRASIMAQH